MKKIYNIRQLFLRLFKYIAIVLILLVVFYFLYPGKSVYMIVDTVRFVNDAETIIMIHGSSLHNENNYIYINNKYKPVILKSLLYNLLITDLKCYKKLSSENFDVPNFIVDIKNKRNNKTIIQILSFNVNSGNSYTRCSVKSIKNKCHIYINDHLTRSLLEDIIQVSNKPDNLVSRYSTTAQ